MFSGPAADVVGQWGMVLVNQETPPVVVDSIDGCGGSPGTVEILSARLTLGGDGTWVARRTARTTCGGEVAEAERTYDGGWSFEVSDSTLEMTAARPDELRIGPGRLGWDGRIELPLEERPAGRYYLLVLAR